MNMKTTSGAKRRSMLHYLERRREIDSHNWQARKSARFNEKKLTKKKQKSTLALASPTCGAPLGLPVVQALSRRERRKHPRRTQISRHRLRQRPWHAGAHKADPEDTTVLRILLRIQHLAPVRGREPGVLDTARTGGGGGVLFAAHPVELVNRRSLSMRFRSR